MASYRLKVQFLTNFKPTDKDILAHLADTCPGIIVTDIYFVRGGAMIVIEDQDYLHMLLSDKVNEKLRTHNLHCPQPNWYTASKTLFIPKARDLYTTCEPQELLTEVNHLNEFQAQNVEIIRKQGSVRATIKITMVKKEDADLALEKGIKMHHSLIKPEFIQRNTVLNVKQCYRCFRFDHYSSSCQSPYCYCSKCGYNHHFSECPNPQDLYCLNCRGVHSAVSDNCPERIKRHEDLHWPSAKPNDQNAPKINNDITFPSLPSKPTSLGSRPDLQPLSQNTKASDSGKPKATPNKNVGNPACPSSKISTLTPPNSDLTEVSPKQYLMYNAWNIRFQIQAKYVELFMENSPDADLYLDMMNEYLIDNDLDPIKPYSKRPKTPKTIVTSTPERNNNISPNRSKTKPSGSPFSLGSSPIADLTFPGKTQHFFSTPLIRPDPFFPPYMEDSQIAKTPTQKTPTQDTVVLDRSSQDTLPNDSTDRNLSLVVDSTSHKAHSDGDNDADSEEDNQTVVMNTDVLNPAKNNLLPATPKVAKTPVTQQTVQTRIISGSYANSLKSNSTPKTKVIKVTTRKASSVPDISDRVLRSDSESGPEDGPSKSRVTFKKAVSAAVRSVIT